MIIPLFKKKTTNEPQLINVLKPYQILLLGLVILLLAKETLGESVARQLSYLNFYLFNTTPIHMVWRLIIYFVAYVAFLLTLCFLPLYLLNYGFMFYLTEDRYVKEWLYKLIHAVEYGYKLLFVFLGKLNTRLLILVGYYYALSYYKGMQDLIGPLFADLENTNFIVTVSINLYGTIAVFSIIRRFIYGDRIIPD